MNIRQLLTSVACVVFSASNAFAATVVVPVTPLPYGNWNFLNGSSGSLSGDYDFTYTFSLGAEQAFTADIGGWWGIGDSFAAKLNNTALTKSALVDGTHLTSALTSGSTSYSLHVYGTTLGGATPSFNYNLNGVAPVPEPETFAMLLAGLGLIGAITRRRKGKSGVALAA
jgi:hypothetical protein